MITSAREVTLADVQETVELSGQAVHFVDVDAHGEPTVWIWYPGESVPHVVLRRVDLVDAHRAIGWATLTGPLPHVGQ